MRFIMKPEKIKEWLMALVEENPKFWKTRVTDYSDGVKDVIVWCFTTRADRDFFPIVSEALDVLFNVMENGNDTCGISAHLCQTGSHRTTFEVSFYWEERD